MQVFVIVYVSGSIFTSLRDGNRPHRIVGLTQQGHWDQKHPKVLIVGKKKREEFDGQV